MDRKEFVNSLKIDNRRKIKNQPSNKKYTPTKGMNKKIAAILAMGVLGLGLVACKEPDKKEVVNQPSTITYSSTLTGEEKLENLVKKAEQDFLKKYLEAYNKEYETDYMSYEAKLCTNSIKEGVVYVVDGKLVTPGSYPELVKQQLSEYGTVTSEDGHDKVMQILVKRDNDTIVLGTYDQDLNAMYSGTDLSNFGLKLPKLTEIGIDEKTTKRMFELEHAKGVESEDSIQMRLDKYNKAVSNEEKGYEIGD